MLFILGEENYQNAKKYEKLKVIGQVPSLLHTVGILLPREQIV
jgi:hypothetical protein